MDVQCQWDVFAHLLDAMRGHRRKIGEKNNSDQNTPGSPRALLLEGDLATPFLPLLPVLPKSWEGSGRPQLSVSKVYKMQVGKRGW